ncbi:Protein kinase domain-containing protein [Mycena chlorophos]|uniref:Protein kinase domain-containing protein n=1 Tax=Mycena chlorophos TaxID=658473 RepID=A0A8H6T8J3_MYCCL|nr:Protein kinase domain-containing protein [Mycena chlorophos]
MPGPASQDGLVDLTGKVVFVTGGNAGIGFSTIQILARKGAKVYMGTRSEERGMAAIQKLEAEGLGEGSVHLLKLDLSSVCGTVSAAEEFLQKETRLDILVNNAGRTPPAPYPIDSQGLRDVMAINHVAHFALTEALLPLLEKTAKEDGSDVRIVNVTSAGHLFVAPKSFASFESLNEDFGMSLRGSIRTYGLSKLANILHMKELQKRVMKRAVPIMCVSVHPGAVKTDGNSFGEQLPIIGHLVYKLLFRPLDYGGRTVAFAAAGKKVTARKEKYRGVYLVPVGKLGKPSKAAKNERLAAELYKTTTKVVDDLLEAGGRKKLDRLSAQTLTILVQMTAPQRDLVDLKGKVVLLTGGNAGIGYTTIQMLARQGAKVYMGARDEGRAMAAIKKLEAEGTGAGSVHWLKLDLSTVCATVSAAEEFKTKETRLDILVNNAGRQSPGPFNIDSQGIREVMAINHVAHFALTEALLPLLEQTAKQADSDVRIVNVSSVGHTFVAPESFASLESLNEDYGDSLYNSLQTYGLTKLANILHIKDLQKRLKRRSVPITCLAVHPGAIRTEGTYSLGDQIPFVGRFLYWLIFGSVDNGAKTVVFAAAGKQVAADKGKYEGSYIVPSGKLATPSASARNERLAAELYDTTTKVVDDLLVAGGRQSLERYE